MPHWEDLQPEADPDSRGEGEAPRPPEGTLPVWALGTQGACTHGGAESCRAKRASPRPCTPPASRHREAYPRAWRAGAHSAAPAVRPPAKVGPCAEPSSVPCRPAWRHAPVTVQLVTGGGAGSVLSSAKHTSA